MGNRLLLFTTTSNCVLVCLCVTLLECILLLLNVVLNVSQPALSHSSNRWLPAGHRGFVALTSAQLVSGLYSYSTTTTTITSVRCQLDVHTCVGLSLSLSPNYHLYFPLSQSVTLALVQLQQHSCHHLGSCTCAALPSCYCLTTSFFPSFLFSVFSLCLF